ncbi:MAG: DNA repair exonuclease [Bacillota bacterium]
MRRGQHWRGRVRIRPAGIGSVCREEHDRLRQIIEEGSGAQHLYGRQTMIRFLHLADLHLGWSPSFLEGDRRAARRRERDAALRRAVDWALREDVHFVLIAGDLFDSHAPGRGTAREAAEQLARLERAGLRVITVPGNHDEISYHNSIYRREGDSWPGYLVTDPMPAHCLSFEVSGTSVHLYSMAYTGGVTNVSGLGQLPRLSEGGIHIGVFHGSLDWDAGERSLPLSSRALERAGYHYTALGHIHRHQVTRVGGGLCCYAGMVEHKSLAEPGVGHLTIVSAADDEITLEKPPLPARDHRWETIDVSPLSDQDELIRRCRELANPEAVVGVQLRGAATFPLIPGQLQDALEGEFFHLEVKDDSSLVEGELAGRYENELTVRGQFVRDMTARIRGAESAREERVLKMALSLGLSAFVREGSP